MGLVLSEFSGRTLFFVLISHFDDVGFLDFNLSQLLESGRLHCKPNLRFHLCRFKEDRPQDCLHKDIRTLNTLAVL